MDRFIRTFQETLSIIRDFLEALRSSIEKLFKMIFATNPKPMPHIRAWPKIIKCIGQPFSGYSTRLRTRTRNSC